MVGLLAAQSASSLVLETNEAVIQRHPVIVFFLTMLVGAGGNAGDASDASDMSDASCASGTSGASGASGESEAGVPPLAASQRTIFFLKVNHNQLMT